MTWLLEHYVDIMSIYGSIVAIATIIVKFTKTTKDDSILAKIIKILDYFSTAFTAEDAAKLASATKKSKK